MAGAFNVSGPGQASSGNWRNTDHIGHQPIFGNPVEQERTGQNGKYLVAHCDFVVCLTCKKGWTDTDVSGKVLAPAILAAESKSVVTVRLGEGEAKEGQSAAVLALDPLPEEVELAQECLARYALQYPTGRVSFDVIAYNADNAAPPEGKF